jgi:hypothetical protein
MNRRFALKSFGALLAGSLIFDFAKAPLSKIFAGSNPDNTLNIFNSIIKNAQDESWKDLPISKLIENIALYFVDTPYVGGTLDVSEIEKCIVNLSGLDCVTFFENSLCLARIIKKDKTTFQSLLDEVTFTRYRSGVLKDYSSRLHYTSDWITDNINKKVIRDITNEIALWQSEIGAAQIKFNVGFMSENPQYYAALKDNPQMIKKIAAIEEEIKLRDYYLIPTPRIKLIEPYLQTGDIIAIATSKKGLDYSHTGLTYVDEAGKVHFLHASLKAKKVIIDTSISQYVSNIKTNIGITVLRPLNVV